MHSPHAETGSGSATCDEITITASLERLQEVRDFIDNWCQQHQILHDATWLLIVATDEICSNIIRHGYRSDSSKTLRICLRAEPSSCTVEIHDTSLPFNPCVAVTEQSVRLTRSGHGLTLANQIAHISYTPRNGSTGDNITRITVPFTSS
ncbi:MAG: ATP-binding protein [Chlorobi bacterium]|nr:ATP-binding protein [Chlorobiota bacterium]